MLEAVIDIVFSLLDALIDLLPMSPFLFMLNGIDKIDFLGFLNYFIPFDACLTMIEAWLVCVAVYLVIKNIKQVISWIKGLVG